MTCGGGRLLPFNVHWRIRVTESQPTYTVDQLRGAIKKPSKYRNEATVVDGIRFASKAEAARWQTLRMLEHQGEITGLKRQVRHKLLIETTYVSDFEYFEKDGSLTVEDVKGMRTREYKRKAKAMKQLGIEVREIRI